MEYPPTALTTSSHLSRSFYPTFSSYDNYTEAYTPKRVTQGSYWALVIIGAYVIYEVRLKTAKFRHTTSKQMTAIGERLCLLQDLSRTKVLRV